MTDFPTAALSELCEAGRAICYGIVQPGTHIEDGVPIVRVNNFRTNHLDLNEVMRVDPAIDQKFKRSRPKPNDVLISLVGSLGQVAIAPPELVGWNLARAVGLIPIHDPHKAQWVFFALQAPEAQQFIRSHANTTVQATFNLGDLSNLSIPYPDRPEREAILTVLSTLDDKIELNRRMNETLEALAQAIFKDWFVDFGPTRRKSEGATDPVAILGNLIPDPTRATQTAALFPATFGDDGLPEGWQDKGLDEVAEFLNGLALQKYPPTGKDDLAVIKIAELRNGITAKTDRANRFIADKYVIKDGDFLFSWSGSLLAKFWTEGEGALNQHLFKVSSETHPRWFYSQWVFRHMPEFQTIAASKATTMGHIQRGHLSAARVIVPLQPTLHAMTAIVEPLIERIIHNDLESRTLAETRDYLLPKLMSGEVRVRGAEKIAG